MKTVRALAPIALPFSLILYFIFTRCRGFYVLDDWHYILSFKYLAAGDLKALWASFCEHRPIIAKSLHYLSYWMGYDGKPLLVLSQTLRFFTACLLVIHLYRQAPFAHDRLSAFSKIAAVLAASLILFSPVQAWAIVRATYIESYICVLGAVMLISGAEKGRWRLIAVGLLLSLVSTPGWMVLVPLFLIVLLIAVFSLKDHDGIRRAVTASAVLLFLICFLIVYKLPFSHPSEHLGCTHPSTAQMLSLILTRPLFFINHFIALLGFPMGWSPGWMEAENTVSYLTKYHSAYAAGLAYLLLNAYCFVVAWRDSPRYRFAAHILLWTLLLAGAMTASRVTVMGEVFVVNYFYPVYLTTGWATLFYFMVHHAATQKPAGPPYKRIAPVVSIVSIIFISLLFGYAKGARMLVNAAGGMRYQLSRYQEAFVWKTVDENQARATAELIYGAYPNILCEVTRIFKDDLNGFPRNWVQREP